jgi:hypothetical protein
VLSRAFDSWIIPLLGFFLLPWTTLTYAAFWDRDPGAMWSDLNGSSSSSPS